MRNFFGLKKIKAKHGFTLVEVVIAVAVLAVLMAAMVTLFNPVRKMINSVSRDGYTDMVMTDICDYLRKSLDTARDISIFYADETLTSSDEALITAFIDKDAGKEYRCLMLSGEQTDKNGVQDNLLRLRLYDFSPSDVSAADTVDRVLLYDLNTLKLRLQNTGNSTDKILNYSVFFEPYYCRNNYKIYFDKKTGDGTWIQIKLEAFSDRFDDDAQIAANYGIKASADKIISVKLLNETAVLSIDGNLSEEYDFTANKRIIILYRK